MLRGPPYPSRREAFVDLALRYADDDSHGYSQKPPSGRWGPDYDCSSLLYVLANEAGYPVGTGGDKVRFTGTMLKDFEKAGFQILPFANVGISDLEIGDILLNLALHAEVYVGNGESIGATGSETGGYVGEAGDQTGREIERHPVTTFDKEWDYVLRPPSEEQEGDKEVPYYGQNPNAWGGNGQTMYPQSTVPMGRNYNTGYPQGNPGQSLTFNTEILHTGCAECHRVNTGAVTLRMQQAIYDIFFKANIGSTTAATPAQFTIFLNGSPMGETSMISTTAAVGDLNNVACETGVRTCCCGPETITLVNNGETTIVVENPLLKIKRVA